MRRLLMEWALTSSLLILAVIALRAVLGKRISAALRYALWAVVLVRLLVPVQFFSLPVPAVLPDVDNESVITDTAPLLQGQPTGTPAVVEPPPDGVVVTYDTATVPSDVSLNVTSLWDILVPLWLAGSVLLAAAFLFSNRAFALRLRRVRVLLEGADCPLPVYRADGLPSPCLFGLVRPAVYVTAEAVHDPVMLRHVLAHEHTHFRHADHVWNLLRSAALAVHWWNPLVWWAAILSRRDCELACDEGALKRLGDGERVAYGRTLLSLITVKPGPGDLLRCATTMTGGQKSVFDRVARIARAPKRWLWAAVVVVLAATLACVFAFGQAKDTDTLDLDADLSFSLTDDGTGVRIEGSVDGTEIQHTLWFAPSWFEPQESRGYPLGQLWFQVPLCERTPSLDACWTDARKTAVRVTATPTAMFSSYSQAGTLIFTADVSKGTLLELEGYIPKMAGGQAERVPTEEEAVRVARIAAKLLAEAEAYYQSHAGELPPQGTPEPSPQPAPEPLPLPETFADVLRGEAKFVLNENEPPVSLEDVPAIIDPYDSYMSPLRYAVVDLSGDGMPEVLVYVCGVSGDMAGYLLLWDNGGQMRGELFDHHDWRNRWFDDLKTDGTFLCSDALGVGWSGISRLRYTPADGWTLYSEAVYRSSESPYGEIKPGDLERFMIVGRDCSDEEFQEALDVQRAKPDVPWYKLPLEDFGEGVIPEAETLFSWIRPSSEMFGFDGVYAQLYDIIVDHCQANNVPERCSIPEVQVFGVDEQAGAYYCIVTSASLYYQESDPLVLDFSVSRNYCKIDTIVEDGKLIATDINYLSLDGNYEYTKEQLEKIPGLFEAYQNKNAEPMALYWETPTREELVREYFNQTDYHFAYALNLNERKVDFPEWLNGEH